MTPVYARVVEYAFVQQLWPKWDEVVQEQRCVLLTRSELSSVQGKGDIHKLSAWIKNEGLCGPMKPQHWMSLE